MSSLFGNDLSTIEERICDVNGLKINFVRTGTGEHVILLLPGALGTIWSNFKPQVENLDKKKFTIIAWDPPGYGKSRPPDRTFHEDFLRRDADVAFNLMKTLGYNKFSLIGYSMGGITSLILAAKYPESIHKMIVIGSSSRFSKEEMNRFESVSDFKTWQDDKREWFFNEYGKEYATYLWNAMLDSLKVIYYQKGGYICDDDLPKIKCPTLIVHGDEDETILPEHSKFLKTHIKNSRLKIFKSTPHGVHLIHPDEFNKLAEEFLVKDGTSDVE